MKDIHLTYDYFVRTKTAQGKEQATINVAWLTPEKNAAATKLWYSITNADYLSTSEKNEYYRNILTWINSQKPAAPATPATPAAPTTPTATTPVATTTKAPNAITATAQVRPRSGSKHALHIEAKGQAKVIAERRLTDKAAGMGFTIPISINGRMQGITFKETVLQDEKGAYIQVEATYTPKASAVQAKRPFLEPETPVEKETPVANQFDFLLDEPIKPEGEAPAEKEKRLYPL